MFFGTAYLPPVEYFGNQGAAVHPYYKQIHLHVYHKIISKSDIQWACEIFFRSSPCRSRCYIYSANGPLVLNVPVRRGGPDLPTSFQLEIEIDYDEAWIPLHKKAFRGGLYIILPSLNSIKMIF